MEFTKKKKPRTKVSVIGLQFTRSKQKYIFLYIINKQSENDIENNSIHIHFKKNKIGRNKFNQRSTDMYIKDYTPS